MSNRVFSFGIMRLLTLEGFIDKIGLIREEGKGNLLLDFHSRLFRAMHLTQCRNNW